MSIILRYGPVSVAYRSNDPTLTFETRPPHDQFEIPATGTVDLELSWNVGVLAVSRLPSIAIGGSVWEARRSPDGGEEVTFFETPQRIPALRLAVDAAYSHGSVTQAPLGTRARTVNVGRYPFDEFIVSRLLGKRRAAIIHASCVTIGRRAVLFVGHSGAGKSTISSLMEAEGARVLSDDRTILTCDGEEVRAWGTPWHGSGRRAIPTSEPLAAMFLLQQSDVNAVKSCGHSQAVKELFVRAIQPRVTQEEVENCLDLLDVVCARVPLQTLHFRPEPDAARKVIAVIGR